MSRPISVRSVLRQTFTSYTANALALLATSTVAVAIVGILEWNSTSRVSPGLIPAIVNLLTAASFICMVVLLVANAHSDEPVNPAWTSSTLARTIGELVLVMVVSSLAVGLLFEIASIVLLILAVSVVLSLKDSVGTFVVSAILSTLVLIAPAMLLIVNWSVMAPVAVLERPGRARALGRSRALVRSNRWRVVGLFAVIVVLIAIGGAMALAAHALGSGPAHVADALIAIVIAPIPIVAATELYLELREA